MEPQAVALDNAVQPHTLAVPPPPQVLGLEQVPHAWDPPQPFGTLSHLPAQAVAFTFGTH